MKRSISYITDVFLLFLWLVGCAFALFYKSEWLLGGFDGGYMRNLARRQFEWGTPVFSASLDLFHGLGDQFPVNFTLFPSFAVASMFSDGPIALVLTYTIILAEFSVASIFFARCLGVTRTEAIAATAVTCILMFPFRSPTLTYPILVLSPLIGTGIALALVMGGSFITLGRHGRSVDLALATLTIAVLSWSILASPTMMILMGPFLLLCGATGILSATRPGERRKKVWFAIGLLLLLLVTGPLIYVGGLIINTAASTFPSELANDRATFTNASILFQWTSFGPAGPLFVVFAILGSLLSIFDRNSVTLRVLAIALLTYLGTRLTFATLTIIFDFWRGPVPLYFEFFVYPLYAVFAIRFVIKIFSFVWRTGAVSAATTRMLQFGTVTTAVAAAVFFGATTPTRNLGFPYPPKSTSITGTIAKDSGISPGSIFQGRTANMTGQSIKRGVVWFDLHAFDGDVARQTGNEMRLSGLHLHGIPSIFEYSPAITPALYAVTTRLLALPDDRQRRNVLVLRRINNRILAMLGVRFIIVDASINDGVKLRESIQLTGVALNLYEIENPNLGNYSPTRVAKPDTATDAIRRMSSPDFDPTHEIIANVQGNVDSLTPARDVKLTLESNSIHVEAISEGASIILLPFEFTRCLRLTSAQAETPELFRANLVETGLLFSKKIDARLSIQTGPFLLNPSCRLRDYFDMTALKIGEVPKGWSTTPAQ